MCYAGPPIPNPDYFAQDYHQAQAAERRNREEALRVIREAYRNPEASFRTTEPPPTAHVYHAASHTYETVPMRTQVKERLRLMPVTELEEHLRMCKLCIEEARAMGLSTFIENL